MSGAERRYTVAVAGATGAVGSALLEVLAEQSFPIAKLHLLGRDTDEQESAVFANRNHPIRPIDEFDFTSADLALFCLPDSLAATHVPRALAAGCAVVDLSRHSRLGTGVPLVVSGINSEQLAAGTRLVASPAAAVVQASAVLAPIARAAGLVSVVAHTTQAVSCRGKAAVAELAGQTARLLNVQAISNGCLPAQIAFNLITTFDAAHADDYTDEEREFGAELRKVLGIGALSVQASFAIAPVFYGHTQVLEIETAQPLNAAEARRLLAEQAGVTLLEGTGVVSPVGDGAGSDEVLVGRVRQGEGNRLTVWSVADNIRKGAAVNTAEIAFALLKAHP